MRTKRFFSFLLGLVLGIQGLSAAPVVSSVSPTNGGIAGGYTVTITGTGFTGTSDVDFGFRPATSFTVVNDTSITATVPEGTVGTVDVLVKALSETSPSTPNDYFTYTAASWNGIISRLTPDEVALFATDTDTFTVFIPVPAAQGSVITPDGTLIYSADEFAANITVIDAASNTVVGNIPTSVGTGAYDIIVNPSGSRIYVSNNVSGYLTVVDTSTSSEVTSVFIGPNLGPLSITPDGSTVFISDFNNGTVALVDTTSNTIVNTILTGATPGMTSITPDGTKAFVANLNSDTISVINLPAQVVTKTISLPTGSGPYGSTILPNGQLMYVVNYYNSTVTVVDVPSETITATINLPPYPFPFWAASTPDSKTVYIINETNDEVTPIDVATNTVGSFALRSNGGHFKDIVMSPDPAPVAAFIATPQPVGTPTIFDASTSISPIGTIVSYAWNFGDGHTITTTSPITTHTYVDPGSFTVTLTVTNSAGTSTSKVFSSRFMSNNGGPSARRAQIVQALPAPPTHLKGFQKRCQFPSQTDIVNVLEWSPPVGVWQPVAYEIFRDPSLTDLIGVVPGGKKPLEFSDHNRRKKTNYTYYVVSVSSTRTRSPPVSVTIHSKY